MSNLEHLLESGLICFTKMTDRNDWIEYMRKNPHLLYVDLTVDDLWTICQYVECVWIPERELDV